MLIAIFQFSVSFFDYFINLSNACDYNLSALTSEELKKHYVINMPPNFLHAPEGVALICFTSGLCFASTSLSFYDMLVEVTLSAKVVSTPSR